MRSISIFILLIYWSVILLAPIMSKEDNTDIMQLNLKTTLNK